MSAFATARARTASGSGSALSSNDLGWAILVWLRWAGAAMWTYGWRLSTNHLMVTALFKLKGVAFQQLRAATPVN